MPAQAREMPASQPARTDDQPPAAPNLYQRLCAIAAEITGVRPTGKNFQNRRAISISDVEDAVGAKLAEHGVLTLWSLQTLEYLPDQKLWVRTETCTYVNVDDPTETAAVVVADVGNNPAAASSFVRKLAYKALFHITEEDEEEGSNPAQQSVRQRPRDGDGDGGHVQEHPYRSETLPQASPHKAASANQLATIAKLSRLLGKPEEPREDLTSAEASDRITELSREYNERKGAAGARRS